MKETIMYNACDENNWSDPKYVQQVGGEPYPAAAACGQGKQSYQDYKCTAEDDAIAGGKMACDVDNDMEMRAHTKDVLCPEVKDSKGSQMELRFAMVPSAWRIRLQ